MLAADPLVAEHATDLVDALHPADQQSLEVQLKGDAEVQIDVEGVVVGHERPGRRAPGNGLHCRPLDLDITALGQHTPERGDDPGTPEERLHRLRIAEQVDVPLPAAPLDVGQTVPLLGRRKQAFAQERELLGEDGQFAGVG